MPCAEYATSCECQHEADETIDRARLDAEGLGLGFVGGGKHVLSVSVDVKPLPETGAGQPAMSQSQGGLQQTGNSLDVAVKGAGFLQIQMPDGTTAYTRDGSFQLSGTGQIVTNAGHPVLPGITVPANAQAITIANNGTVSVTIPGQVAPQVLGQLQLANFINPPGLDPRGENLFAETAASGAPSTGAPDSNGLGPLASGFVETSNVSVIEELVSMIQTQRAYEINSKAVQTSDQMLQKLGQL